MFVKCVVMFSYILCCLVLLCSVVSFLCHVNTFDVYLKANETIDLIIFSLKLVWLHMNMSTLYVWLWVLEMLVEMCCICVMD